MCNKYNVDERNNLKWNYEHVKDKMFSIKRTVLQTDFQPIGIYYSQLAKIMFWHELKVTPVYCRIYWT